MRYLVSWAFELWGRSGNGMGGANLLSHAEVEAWARLTDTRIDPLEVKALIRLDAAIHRAKVPVKETKEKKKVKETPAWPS